jgi:hypothetical protein
MRFLRFLFVLILSLSAAYGGGWLAYITLSPRPLEIIALPESDKKFWRFDSEGSRVVGQMTMPLFHDPEAKHIILCAEPEENVPRFDTNRNLEIEVHELDVETKAFAKPIPQVVTAGAYRKLPSGEIWSHCAKVIDAHKNLPGCHANNFFQVSQTTTASWREELCQWANLVPSKATISILVRRYHDRIEIVDAATGKSLRRLDISPDVVIALWPTNDIIWAISPDEKMVAVSAAERSRPNEKFVVIYHTDTGKESQRITDGISDHLLQHTGSEIINLAYAGVGKLVIQFGEPRQHFGQTTSKPDPGQALICRDLVTGQITNITLPQFYDEKGNSGCVNLVATSENRVLCTTSINFFDSNALVFTSIDGKNCGNWVKPNDMLNRLQSGHYRFHMGEKFSGAAIVSVGQKVEPRYRKHLKHLPDAVQRFFRWDYNMQNTVSWIDSESGEHWVVRNHGIPPNMTSAFESKIHAKIVRDKLYILAPDDSGTTQLEVWSTPPPRPVSMWKIIVASAFAGVVGMGLSARWLLRHRIPTSHPPAPLA